MEKASRKFVQILRHQIVEYNLQADEKGFVSIDEILKLNLKEFKNINMNDIQNIVNTNQKKRLELENKNGIFYIRATQGHNKEVGKLLNDDVALVKIELTSGEKYIYHGTEKQYLQSIFSKGLNRMNRKHIHFVEEFDKKKQISGFKNTSNVILAVDINKCIEDGIIFYKSSNNVILTEGINGTIHYKYIIQL